MEIPPTLLAEWSTLRSPGDLKKIVESMPAEDKVVTETIRRALKDGKASDPVFLALAKYYKEKAAHISTYATNLNVKRSKKKSNEFAGH